MAGVNRGQSEYFRSPVTFDRAVTASSAVTVSGTLTGSSNATIAGTLTGSSNATVSGTATINTLSVSSGATLSGAVTASTNVTVGGAFQSSGAVTASTNLTVGGAFQSSGTITGSSNGTFAGTLTGSSAFKQGLATSSSQQTLTSVGVNALSATGAVAYTLPSVASGLRMVIAKIANSTAILTVDTASTAQTLDGSSATKITLDGRNQSVELMGVSTSQWLVMSSTTVFGGIST